MVFGFVTANPSPKAWVGLEVGYGMVAFGLMQVSFVLYFNPRNLGVLAGAIPQ